MTDTIESHVYGTTFQIIGKWTQGGQGIIWKTNDPCILVKQFAPSLMTDDPREQEELRQAAERAYKAFCLVNKGIQAELSALPREFVTYRSYPGYLMQRAEGELLQNLLREKKITPDDRLPLARALARAIRILHASQIVHADVNPENFIARQDQTGWTVFVLDIDGGGLLSPPGPVYPMSQPKRLYKAPELFAMQWKQLYEKGLFFAPDRWSLAVLLYQLLVDYEGPFCTVKTHPNPEVKNYVPYNPSAYRDTAVSWPAPWQKKLLRRAHLPPRLVSLFVSTFSNRFLLNEQKVPQPRPTAAHWERTLAASLSAPRRGRVFVVLGSFPKVPARGNKSPGVGLPAPRYAYRWANALRPARPLAWWSASRSAASALTRSLILCSRRIIFPLRIRKGASALAKTA